MSDAGVQGAMTLAQSAPAKMPTYSAATLAAVCSPALAQTGRPMWLTVSAWPDSLVGPLLSLPFSVPKLMLRVPESSATLF